MAKIKDDFTASASWDNVRKSLTDDTPYILRGHFTHSGHIIVGRGFDNAAYNGRGAFIINDPNGERQRRALLLQPNAASLQP